MWRLSVFPSTIERRGRNMAKKKKMTPAQAAAARRPDDWVPPQSNQKSSKVKANVPVGTKAVTESVTSKSNRRMYIIFAIVFVLAAIAAPFLVIFVSRLFGIQ